ncbi:MAG: hypothetical protein ABIN74_10265, partial [Ferruginibacter sp.]
NLLAIGLTVWSLFIVEFIRYNWFSFSIKPYHAFLVLAFHCSLIFCLYKHYTQEEETGKINDGVKVFNAQKEAIQFLWISISFAFLILPIVLIACLLNKYF